jgi:hypothetical protein
MTTNPLRADPRHHTHDQPPNHRHQDTPHPQHMDVRRCETGTERPCIGKMRDQANQIQQRQRKDRNGRSHQYRRHGQPKHRPRRGEVPQLTLASTRRPRVRRS